MSAPPDHVIRAAEEAAARPGCMGSRRGVAIYLQRGRQQVIATGRNGQPEPFVCDGGSPRCREVCGKRCVHAERRALDGMLSMLGGSIPQTDHDPSDLDLVHVKIGPDGRVIAGGGPSCWQCSREILDVGIGGVWLYQTRWETCDDPDGCPYCTGESCRECEIAAACANLRPECASHHQRHYGLRVVAPAWVLYSAEAFHRVTLRNCGLEGP